MTLDEIYSEYIRLHPNRPIQKSSIRLSIYNNKHIKPIGRSSRYSLAEWSTGFDRGGTMREFAYECISNAPEKIVSIDELCRYIGQYRACIDAKNIQTNLCAEASKRFRLYQKDGVRYIGLTKLQYDSTYIPIP